MFSSYIYNSVVRVPGKLSLICWLPFSAGGSTWMQSSLSSRQVPCLELPGTSSSAGPWQSQLLLKVAHGTEAGGSDRRRFRCVFAFIYAQLTSNHRPVWLSCSDILLNFQMQRKRPFMKCSTVSTINSVINPSLCGTMVLLPLCLTLIQFSPRNYFTPSHELLQRMCWYSIIWYKIIDILYILLQKLNISIKM